MTKKLLAIHNETGERIEFGIEDMFAFEQNNKLGICIDYQIHSFGLADLGESHTLYYLHEGKYYGYENGEEMI